MYYKKLLQAYCRSLGFDDTFEKSLAYLRETQNKYLICLKKTDLVCIPRVKAVIKILRGIHFESLLDVGTGRAVFLFRFHSLFPKIEKISVDISDHRVNFLKAVHNGGCKTIKPMKGDITNLSGVLDDNSVDVVTILEVLEHLEHPELAAKEAIRLAKVAVIFSVPSKPDDNPEHIQLFTPETVSALFVGCKVKIQHVPEHIIGVVFI